MTSFFYNSHVRQLSCRLPYENQISQKNCVGCCPSCGRSRSENVRRVGELVPEPNPSKPFSSGPKRAVLNPTGVACRRRDVRRALLRPLCGYCAVSATRMRTAPSSYGAGATVNLHRNLISVEDTDARAHRDRRVRQRGRRHQWVGPAGSIVINGEGLEIK